MNIRYIVFSFIIVFAYHGLAMMNGSTTIFSIEEVNVESHNHSGHLSEGISSPSVSSDPQDCHQVECLCCIGACDALPTPLQYTPRVLNICTNPKLKKTYPKRHIETLLRPPIAV